MNAQTPIPPADQAAKLNPVEAKQGTDAPKGMPVVLLVSIVGAAVGMWIVWSYFF